MAHVRSLAGQDVFDQNNLLSKNFKVLHRLSCVAVLQDRVDYIKPHSVSERVAFLLNELVSLQISWMDLSENSTSNLSVMCEPAET